LTYPAVPTITTAAATCAANGTATMTNYSAGLTYTFSPSGPSVGAGGVISSMTTGTSYTVTAGNGSCTSASSASFSIAAQLITPPVPTINTTAATCAAAGTATITNYVGTQTYTFTPAGPTAGAGGVVSGMTAGTSYTVTASNGSCTSAASASFTQQAQLNVPSAPVAAVTQPTCAIPTGTIVVSSPLGSNIQYSIGGSYQTSTSFAGLSSGNYTITAQDASSGCISAPTSVTVNAVPPSPSITLVDQTNISCSGDTDGEIEVSVSGGLAPYTQTWSPNVGSGTVVSNLSAGNYTFTVTDANGCSATSNYTVTAPAPLVVSGIANNIDCGVSLGSITTSITGGTGPFTYGWSPNSQTTSTISGLYTGTYVVTVTDANGCQDTETFNIGLTGNLTLDVTPPSAYINEGESVDLLVTGATSYVWNPSTSLSCNDCPNPVATPNATTTYIVTGTDATGCEGTTAITILVEQFCEDFFVPNIFSPNGTGPDVNNTLCVYGSCIIELEYAVFNRWGEKVFETTNTAICWDGNWRGEPVGSGVFAYKLKAVLSNGSVIEKAGNLTVVY
jgi:hypothetical protein